MSPHAHRGPPPESLKLRKHLEMGTQPELDEFRRFWAPHDQAETTREALVDRLARLMADENVVYGKVELLSEKVRSVLFALLRAPHHTAELQGLFRYVDGQDMEYYEAEAALTALARRGFVRIRRARDWLHYGRNHYAIPEETALVMRGLAGGDRRTLEQIFRRSSFRPGSPEGAASKLPGEVPADIAAAVESLPTAGLRELATDVLERYGGLLTRHEFPAAFGERRIRWDSARFLSELGSRGLGTVGHLDLRNRGLGVDDDAVLFFEETVERYIEQWRKRPLVFDRALCAHGDLMSDVATALTQVQESPVRVGKEGSVYKAARGRIGEKLLFPLQPLLERDDVADRVMTIVRGLDLARDDGEGLLVVTEAGAAWAGRPLREKARAAYDLVCRDGLPTLRSQHLVRVHAHLVGILSGPGGAEGWWPGSSLAHLARNRYLLELARDESAAIRSPLSVRQAALTELGLAAQDLLVRDFFALGLVDVAMRGQEAVGVRLSPLGRRILLPLEEADPSEARPLIVNPDFEMLVLPEGDVDELLHALDRIALRSKSGEVTHYHLDRERIERFCVAGGTADSILDLLLRHSRAALPQNVEYSIRSWAERVRSATIERGVLFRASDPSVVQAILDHPMLKGLVKRVVDPTTIFFDEKAMERQLTQELRGLGVYVK